MKKIVFIIFLLGIVLFIIDKKSAEYGNGFLFMKKSLLYGTEITTVNQTYIIYDGGWGYIMPHEYFITNDDDSIYVNKLLGYAIVGDSLYFKIMNNTEKVLIFGSSQSVYNKTPIVLSSSRSDIHWIELDEDKMPILVYYWRLIAIIISTLILFFLYILIFKLIKNILCKRL